MTRNEFGGYVDDDREAMIDSDDCKPWLDLWATWKANTVLTRTLDGAIVAQSR
jgi:hypothetical protein